jgi:hypothetical protein
MLYGDFRIFQHYTKSSASNKSTLEMNSLKARKKQFKRDVVELKAKTNAQNKD